MAPAIGSNPIIGFSSCPDSLPYQVKLKSIYIIWRRGRDSNPRYGLTYTRFPSVLFRPLRHLSGILPGSGSPASRLIYKPTQTRIRVSESTNQATNNRLAILTELDGLCGTRNGYFGMETDYSGKQQLLVADHFALRGTYLDNGNIVLRGSFADMFFERFHQAIETVVGTGGQ